MTSAIFQGNHFNCLKINKSGLLNFLVTDEKEKLKNSLKQRTKRSFENLVKTLVAMEIQHGLGQINSSQRNHGTIIFNFLSEYERTINGITI